MSSCESLERLDLEQLNRWCEVDLDALHHNFNEVRKFVPENVKIMAVVKDDAYGHGLAECGKFFAKIGADYLAVTTVDEGIILRNAGVLARILVFAPMLPAEAELFIKYDLIPTIANREAALALNYCAEKMDIEKVNIHLKINTGMNRVGINIKELPNLIGGLQVLEHINVEGAFSHLAVSTDEKESRKQIEKFKEAITILENLGYKDLICHICASNGIVNFPDAYFQMVRAGSILYGQTPIAKNKGINTKNAWTLKARIINVLYAEKGEGIGYGFDTKAKSNMKLGVIPLGYCDGVGLTPNARNHCFKGGLSQALRIVKNIGNACCYDQNKNKINFVGRVSMQLTTVDLTNKDLNVGDILNVPARRALVNDIVPKVYLENDKVVLIKRLG